LAGERPGIIFLALNCVLMHISNTNWRVFGAFIPQNFPIEKKTCKNMHVFEFLFLSLYIQLKQPHPLAEGAS